ncbi:MAG: Lrp/AsnC family transcriptional regulator, partial [Thermoplasmata archaeon]
MSKPGSSAHPTSAGVLSIRNADRKPLAAGRWVRSRSVGLRMGPEESLDFSILREWASEDVPGLGIDPRRSPEFIAKRLGVSPATVRRRLSTWRARGFLLGYDVIPHPGLLGGRLLARVLNFASPIAEERAIRALSLIDGVIQITIARTMAMAIYFVDSESQAERRLRQLQDIEGTTEIGPEMRFDLP